MKKVLVLLAVVSMMFCISACTTETDELPVTGNKTTQQQATVKETETTPVPATSTPNVNNYYQQQQTQVPKQTSTTVAISNAIIVEDNHDNMVVYKKKCDTCGHVEPGQTVVTPGSFTGGFYCPNCKEQKVIKIQTTYSN